MASTQASATFSGRCSKSDLDFADALSQREYGVSFGKYCAKFLLDFVTHSGRLPQIDIANVEERSKAFATMRRIAGLPHDETIGKMSDSEIKELIASRYEA